MGASGNLKALRKACSRVAGQARRGWGHRQVDAGEQVGLPVHSQV